jgi:hypothetical protein
MRMWANFDPRLARPRTDAGQLYYPAQYSHMFELHWDFLHAPTQESALNEDMGRYASAAARLTFTKDALVDAEAPENSLKIASSGAMSRRFPVQDAQDYFSSLQEQAQEEQEMMSKGLGVDRSSPDTEGSASSRNVPGGSIVGSELPPGSGRNGTCAGRSRPPIPDPALSLRGGFPG